MQDKEELIRRAFKMINITDSVIKEAFDKYDKNKANVIIKSRAKDLGDRIVKLYPRAKIKVKLLKDGNEWDIDFDP